jgi:Linear amide C-N hydrolases, choloylglycine hydrolase family
MMKHLNTCKAQIARLFVAFNGSESVLIGLRLRSLAAVLGVVIGSISHSSRTEACSVSAVAPGAPALVGGNYDWSARGGIVFVSPRGQVKTSDPGAALSNSAHWTSQYASLTLSQFGRDYPMQGMNEKGLVGMVLMGPSDYPSDGVSGVVTENLWLQYQLDRFSTLDEVEAHIHELGVRHLSASLHWFMCDASNDCAAIEFIRNQAVMYRGRKLPVRALTNTSYEAVIDFYSRWHESQSSIPTGYGSSARFVRLAERDHARTWLDVAENLDDVSLAGFTAWQTLFDLKDRSLTVRLDGGLWHSISFEHLPIECGDTLPMMDLSVGTWGDYDHHVVAGVFARAAFGAPDLGPEIQQKILNSSESVSCVHRAEALK